MAGRVTVYPANMLRPPLCDSGDANMVVIRDSSDTPIMLLARLSGDTWGLATPDDDDWSAMCVRFGLKEAPTVPEILRNASS